MYYLRLADSRTLKALPSLSSVDLFVALFTSMQLEERCCHDAMQLDLGAEPDAVIIR